MNTFTVLGLLLGFGSVILGNIFEGGHTASLIQGSAFFIVMGGTWGAVLVSHAGSDVRAAMGAFAHCFKDPKVDFTVAERMVKYSRVLKKEGLIALEPYLKSINESWEQDGIRMVMDGVTAEQIRVTLEARLHIFEKKLNQRAKVFADAGGFAPTIGILGAVLGLIHVMGNLSDTSKLGAGIAVAFVATIYGVGFSNLLFLPIANKIKLQNQEAIKQKEMLIEGLVSLAQETHPLVIEMKMKSYQYGT